MDNCLIHYSYTNMKITVLSSGSKGNATLIETKTKNILIDAGITLKDLESRIDKDNINIDIIFIYS